MDDLSAAFITSLSHGYADTLFKSGMMPDWVPDSDARAVGKAAFELWGIGQKINGMSILLKCAGQLQNATEVRHLFSLNGTGDVPPAEVVRRCRDRHLAGEVAKYNQRMAQLLRESPDEIGQWLPQAAQKIQALTLTSRAYDARPSAHQGNIVSPVFLKSKIETINRMYAGNAGDGGGHRVGWWTAWIGPTNFGKTTMAYTLGWDALSQGKRISWVAKERDGEVGARLLLALSGMTKDEIEARKCQDWGDRDGYGNWLVDEYHNPIIAKDKDGNPIGELKNAKTRQIILQSWIDYLEINLRIYSPWPKFFNQDLAMVKSIISWDEPDFLMLDFIDVSDVTGRDQVAYGLGGVSLGLQQIAHETKTNVHGFFQMSKEEERKYKENEQHDVGGPYGSVAVKHYADSVIQSRKADAPEMQTNLVTKCKAGGPIDVYPLRYDKHRWVYAEPKRPTPIGNLV